MLRKAAVPKRICDRRRAQNAKISDIIIIRLFEVVNFVATTHPMG